MTSWSSGCGRLIWRWGSRITKFEKVSGPGGGIIHYLSDTLDHRYPISGNLSRLYEYFCYELSRVKAGRNQEELMRVTRMVSELRDSFRQAEKTSGEH